MGNVLTQAQGTLDALDLSASHTGETGWCSMDSAPKDGTVIHVVGRYADAPLTKYARRFQGGLRATALANAERKILPERTPYAVFQALGREYETTAELWAALRAAILTAAQEARHG